MKRGRIESHLLESTLLKGNPLNDPAERELVVCLPPGYEEETSRRYPVVVCLTGFTGSGYMLLNRSAWTPSLPERHDRLMDSGEIGPMILVLPDCFTRLGGSQYLDSTATGRYESHLLKELLPFVESRYRTRPAPDRWAVMGKSSGGYGAVIHAMKHPERFSAFACHSGDMYFEYCYLPDFPKMIRTVQASGGLKGFLSRFDGMQQKSHEAMTAMNIVAMAACYSPHTPHPGPDDANLGIDFPFDLETGELKEEVWVRWLEHDPVRIYEQHLGALAKMKLRFLDCGSRDEFHLQFGARILRDRLKDAGLPVQHEEFDDGHMNVSYRYDRSLVLLSQALGAK